MKRIFTTFWVRKPIFQWWTLHLTNAYLNNQSGNKLCNNITGKVFVLLTLCLFEEKSANFDQVDHLSPPVQTE